MTLLEHNTIFLNNLITEFQIKIEANTVIKNDYNYKLFIINILNFFYKDNNKSKEYLSIFVEYIKNNITNITLNVLKDVLTIKGIVIKELEILLCESDFYTHIKVSNVGDEPQNSLLLLLKHIISKHNYVDKLNAFEETAGLICKKVFTNNNKRNNSRQLDYLKLYLTYSNLLYTKDINIYNFFNNLKTNKFSFNEVIFLFYDFKFRIKNDNKISEISEYKIFCQHFYFYLNLYYKGDIDLYKIHLNLSFKRNSKFDFKNIELLKHKKSNNFKILKKSYSINNNNFNSKCIKRNFSINNNDNNLNILSKKELNLNDNSNSGYNDVRDSKDSKDSKITNTNNNNNKPVKISFYSNKNITKPNDNNTSINVNNPKSIDNNKKVSIFSNSINNKYLHKVTLNSINNIISDSNKSIGNNGLNNLKNINNFEIYVSENIIITTNILYEDSTIDNIILEINLKILKDISDTFTILFINTDSIVFNNNKITVGPSKKYTIISERIIFKIVNISSSLAFKIKLKYNEIVEKILHPLHIFNLFYFNIPQDDNIFENINYLKNQFIIKNKSNITFELLNKCYFDGNMVFSDNGTNGKLLFKYIYNQLIYGLELYSFSSKIIVEVYYNNLNIDYEYDLNIIEKSLNYFLESYFNSN